MKNIKVILFGLLCFLVSHPDTKGQSCEELYEDKLEPTSELIDCGGNFTVETLQNGSCILKKYYPENKMIVFLATYKSDKMKELHGFYEKRWDDGTIVQSGMYSNDLKEGQWIENVSPGIKLFEMGTYHQGIRQGEWQTYDENFIVHVIRNYENGKLHGEQQYFDKDGNVKETETYHHDELLSTTADASTINTEEMPRFPGCENQNLNPDELLQCWKKKLIEFVYGNLTYPEEAKELNIRGDALVQFMIDVDGSVIEPKILNGVSVDIKEAVLAVIKKMPKWRPGMKDGIPVKMSYSLPIKFNFQN
jgi:TonB family protein